ncbi:16S rRNA (guanine(527)-N(7))-methyltransferase RsmG [Anderseniella sp. Alg231-50]|uniref:16S rRNA (guanine(527)-N(7))-methyltransferase RsmG n=1 Tax=Anderseniella sp. Alg231-50 TaxID=1922226 RepID=UPI000D553858
MSQAWLIPETVTPEDLPETFNVSRESLEKLRLYVTELLHWQARINLIAPSTISQVWHRHICDGLQLCDHLRGDERLILDIGSGAGIPGVPLAIWLAEKNTAAEVVMIEANAKKAAFLKQVSRVCSLNTRIINARVELLGKSDLQQVADVCVARALAPLPELLELTAQLPVHPQRMLFLKGQDVDAELTEATKCWNISFCKHSSRTQQNGCILEIHEAERVSKNTETPD